MSSIQPPHDSSQTPAWSVSSDHARSDEFQTSANLADIGRGLSLSETVGVLGLLLPAGCGPEEIWTRGPDLTAVYRPLDNRQLRVTAMWRLGSPSLTGRRVRTWQLILSAQTAKLSTSAELTVLSRVPQATSLWGCWHDTTVSWKNHPNTAAGCWQTLLKGKSGTASRLLIAIHPHDAGFIECEPGANGDSRICCHLFPSDVEKGVLLRSRVLVGIGPETEDTPPAASWVDLLLQQFSQMAPILTA